MTDAVLPLKIFKIESCQYLPKNTLNSTVYLSKIETKRYVTRSQVNKETNGSLFVVFYWKPEKPVMYLCKRLSRVRDENFRF